MKRSPASGSELMSHAVERGTGRLTLSGDLDCVALLVAQLLSFAR